MDWLNGKIGGIVNGVKAMLGIHSPSTVFAGIGENMALGLAEGWDGQYGSIKRSIEGGLRFSPGPAVKSALCGAVAALPVFLLRPQAGAAGAAEAPSTLRLTAPRP